MRQDDLLFIRNRLTYPVDRMCRKKRGQQPTGILIHAAKAIGCSSVSEMLQLHHISSDPKRVNKDVNKDENASPDKPPSSVEVCQPHPLIPPPSYLLLSYSRGHLFVGMAENGGIRKEACQGKFSWIKGVS